MIVSSNTYLKLFDFLVNRIAEIGFQGEEKKLRLTQITTATCQITKEKDGKLVTKSVNVSLHYLLTPFEYFINKRTLPFKGQPASIDDVKLVKAIEFIEKTPKEKQSNPENWTIEAVRLLNEFEQKHNLLPLETSLPELNRLQMENLFLKIVTEREDIFRSGIARQLISTFFGNITSGNILGAWDMLSTDAKKNSVWDGDFMLFNEAIRYMGEFNIPRIQRDFQYEFQTIKLTCEHVEIYPIEAEFFIAKFITAFFCEKVEQYASLVEKQKIRFDIQAPFNNKNFKLPEDFLQRALDALSYGDEAKISEEKGLSSSSTSSTDNENYTLSKEESYQPKLNAPSVDKKWIQLKKMFVDPVLQLFIFSIWIKDYGALFYALGNDYHQRPREKTLYNFKINVTIRFIT